MCVTFLPSVWYTINYPKYPIMYDYITLRKKISKHTHLPVYGQSTSTFINIKCGGAFRWLDMNRRQHWTGSAKGSFFQLFTLLKDKIASWARICAAYDSATSEFKLAVSDNFPLNAIIWSRSCQHGEAALHTLPMFLFTETIPPEGSPLFNFTLCSPFVSFSKYGWIRNTHQTSEKKKVNSVCLAWMCAYVRCRKHCITAGLRDQRMREVIQSDLADDTDQKGVVPSIRASSGGHHCFCFHLRNLTFSPRPLWEK